MAKLVSKVSVAKDQLSRSAYPFKRTKLAWMWYNRYIINTNPVRTCSVCGSPLILVSEVTEQIEGSRFPQTMVIYRCSNQPCQEEKDKQTEKRKQLRKEKDVVDEKRAADKLEQKRIKQKKHSGNLAA